MTRNPKSNSTNMMLIDLKVAQVLSMITQAEQIKKRLLQQIESKKDSINSVYTGQDENYSSFLALKMGLIEHLTIELLKLDREKISVEMRLSELKSLAAKFSIAKERLAGHRSSIL